MSTEGPDSASKDLLREEFAKRVREAVQARDWSLLEHWARQWIQFDPNHSEAFKWLARGATALNKIARAAYAYGRLLDFDPNNEEARNFFSRYPSTLQEQPEKVVQKLQQGDREQRESAKASSGQPILSPEQRQKLSAAELELAQRYDEYQLFAQAATHYQQSFEWYPNQVSALGTARSLHRAKRSLDAVRFLRQQLYHFPNWTDGRLLLGRILLELGHKADAQKEWQNVLQQEPNNQEAFGFLRGLMTSGA